MKCAKVVFLKDLRTSEGKGHLINLICIFVRVLLDKWFDVKTIGNYYSNFINIQTYLANSHEF
jgi:hypothetical protein